jgi:diacylglycerol O-acyltransferase / wax synthase
VSAYQRLSQLDRSFLIYERPSAPMHVGVTAIFDARPLRNDAGGVDFDRVEEYVASRLHRIPRYRQRLAWTPIERHPIWVDDPSFQLRYHLRHSRLPRPGDERLLKRVAGRILSQHLDRHRPLWELWVVEGLEGDRFALVTKVHHCMIDGVAGADLLGALLTDAPVEKPEPAPAWVPQPPPDGVARPRRRGARAAHALRPRRRGLAGGARSARRRRAAPEPARRAGAHAGRRPRPRRRRRPSTSRSAPIAASTGWRWTCRWCAAPPRRSAAPSTTSCSPPSREACAASSITSGTRTWSGWTSG